MIKKKFNEDWVFLCDGKKTKVDLPHDAMIHGKRSKDGGCGSGAAYFEGNSYTYKKIFIAMDDWATKDVILEIEGAYRNSKVFLNGEEIASHTYGYTGYTVSLTDYLHYGDYNTLEITVDNSQVPNSRWYSGAGLYRNVNLYIGEKTHFIFDDVIVKTASVSPITISYDAPHTGDKSLSVEVEVIDGDKLIARNKGAKGVMAFPAIPWSPENPKMYKIRFTLSNQDEILDYYTISYGFRTISFTRQGFFLNGKKTILQGGCVHHDNGILGAVSMYDAEVKKLKILKTAGFNAIRSAHNPCSKELLKACDDLGILVMDEYADMWYYHKNKYDYASDFKDNYISDITSMVKKDINHPCVVLYSLGNELAEPNDEEGLVYLKEMVDLIHKLDNTRMTTMGINFTNLIREELDMHKKNARMYEFYGNADSLVPDYNEVACAIGEKMAEIACAPDSERCSYKAFEIMDVAGYNYAYKRYELDRKIHPERITVGTESMCKDVYTIYQLMKKYPNVVGDFMWTAIDYIGEVGIGGFEDDYKYFEKPYPWILANGGAFDLLGIPTGEALLAAITYGKSKIRLATRLPRKEEALSAWRWTNSRETYSYGDKNIGKEIIAEVFSIYPTVELFLNGKSLGKKKVEGGYASYSFPYEKGTLKAVSTDLSDHQEVAILKTVDRFSRLCIRKEFTGKDLIYIYTEYKDTSGIIDYMREDALKATIIGGEILGFGSANPITEDDYTKASCHAWHGMAMLVVKKTEKECKVTVKSDKETVNLFI